MTVAQANRTLLRVREDVHIHVPAAAVFRVLDDASTYREWLSHHFHDFTFTDADVIAFSLALPLHTDTARLRRDRAETQVLSFVADGPGTIEGMSWAFHAESPREVHLTSELVYRPAGGPFGALLEALLHRPYRTQALRESLWNLKQRVERGA